MQIIHRISIASSPSIQAELASMGILIDSSGLVSFEINEAYQSWPALQCWILKRKPIDLVKTKFSKKEILSANWLQVVPDWHHGYPQPNEDVFGYREATYDLVKYCNKCGIELKQNAPFQMKTEPRWGRNNILQLNWVFDEYFVTPELWASVFEPAGISSRPVLNMKGKVLESVVQLVISEEINVSLDGLVKETCEVCGSAKYLPVTKGMFPSLMGEPIGHAVKTKEYFGSGASAHKCVLISQDIANALFSKNVRGVSLRPVANL